MADSSTINLRFRESQLEWLKWVAILSMLCDHANKIIFHGDIEPMMWFGRLAFPMFAFILAYHYEFHTRNKLRYFIRLAVFAVLSQPIYQMVFAYDQANILCTLALGFLLIAFYDRYRKQIHALDWRYIGTGMLLSAAVFVLSMRVDYYAVGVMVLPLSVLWLRHGDNRIFCLLVGMVGFANVAVTYAVFAILAYAVIAAMMWIDLPLPRAPKYFFYAFYPAHMWVLHLIARNFLS